MRIKNALRVALGCLLLALGAIGLLLPVWPTTPFVLGAAACFASVPALHARIMKIPFVNEHIANYHNKKGLRKKTVTVSLVFLWAMLFVSGLLIKNLWVILCLFLVGFSVTLHILWVAGPREASREKRAPASVAEAVFDVLYLLCALCIGVLLLTRKEYLLASLPLTLAAGDACHLVPRILYGITGSKARLQKALGLGKLAASVSMTVFYVLLWQVGIARFAFPGAPFVTAAVYALAALRIVLCLLPGNRWQKGGAPSRIGVYRNIPFVLLGGVVAVYYALFARSLSVMWVPIMLSFAFYLPVVLWVHKNPKLGMLMLPKSCAYIWMLLLLAF